MKSYIYYNVVHTYISTWYKMSDENKCPLTNTNFLYFKCALLFILEMTLIQQEDYLTYNMIDINLILYIDWINYKFRE